MGISPYQGWKKDTHGFSSKEARDSKANYSTDKSTPTAMLEGKTSHVHRWGYFFNQEHYLWIEDYKKLGGKPKNPNWFSGPRIVIRRQINRQRRLQACLVTKKDFVISKTSYIVKAIDKQITTLKYIFAILNSKILSYIMVYLPFFDMRRIKDDFPTLEPSDFKKLPIPNCSDREKTEIISQLDIVQDKYNNIIQFLKEGGRISISTISSNRTEFIRYSSPESFSFLTYIRDISRIGIFPALKNHLWKLYISDWVTKGYITISGDINNRITRNILFLDSEPPKLSLRNNIDIESDDPLLLQFMQLVIECYNPKKLTEILTKVSVPSVKEVSTFVNSSLPTEKQRVINLILSAWAEEDRLEELIQVLYGVTPNEKKFLLEMMEKWIRK